MVQKNFSIYENSGIIKIQIGGDIFGLSDRERKNIFGCLCNARDSRFLFPNTLYGTALLYDNGLVAANISVGKFDISGTKYIIILYSLKPGSDTYDVNSFMITGDTISQYINILKE